MKNCGQKIYSARDKDILSLHLYEALWHMWGTKVLREYFFTLSWSLTEFGSVTSGDRTCQTFPNWLFTIRQRDQLQGKNWSEIFFSDKIVIFFCISWNLQTNFHLYSVSDPVGGMNSKRACHPPPAFQWPPNSAHCTSQQQFVFCTFCLSWNQ